MRFVLLRLRLSLLKATGWQNGWNGLNGWERILNHLRLVLFRLRRKKSVFIRLVRFIRFPSCRFGWIKSRVKNYHYYFLPLVAKGGLNSEKLCVYSEKLCGKKCGGWIAFLLEKFDNSLIFSANKPILRLINIEHSHDPKSQWFWQNRPGLRQWFARCKPYPVFRIATAPQSCEK